MDDASDSPPRPSNPTLEPTSAPAEPVQSTESSSSTEAAAEGVASEGGATEEPAPVAETNPTLTRFKACRFHADDDGTEYCANRDVLPYAGKLSFAPEAWCPDCALYKLRRTPKKRTPVEEDSYPY
jgi:hypothetical protein